MQKGSLARASCSRGDPLRARRPLRICGQADCVFRALRAAPSLSPTRSSCRRSGSPSCAPSSRNTGSSSWSTPCRSPSREAAAVWLGFGILVALIAGDNLLVAPGELDRQLDVRGRDGRRAPRSLPPSHGARPELLRQPLPGHADEPHHRHLQCALHRREHAGVERASALHGDDLRHRLRCHGELGHGREPGRRCRASWFSSCSAAPPPAGRCTTSLPIAPRRSTAR